MADFDFPGDGQGGGIDLEDRTQEFRIGYRAHISADVHLISMKSKVTTVGDIHLPDMPRLQVHDLHLMGTVDDGIETGTVGLDVVAHIA